MQCPVIKENTGLSTYIAPVTIFVCLFGCFTSQVNSYGHGGTVSLPTCNHTFFLGKLEQAANQYFLHILSLVMDNNPSLMVQKVGE